MSQSRFYGLVLTLCLFSIQLLAGHEVISDLRKGEDIKNASLLIADQYYGQSGNFTVRNRMASIRLYHTDVEKQAYANGWTLDVDYSAVLKFANGTTKNETGTLTIDGDPTDDLIDTNIAQHTFTRIAYASVSVTSVSFKDKNGTTIGTLPNDFFLEVSLSVERIYNINTSYTPEVLTASYSSGDNTLKLAWDYIEGAEEYELEYVFVADGSPSGDDHKDTAVAYSFENAARISLSKNYYNVSMAYPKGSLIFRVRGMGYNGTYSDYRNYREYTNWSYDPSTLAINQAVSHNSSALCYYYTNGLDVNKNWTYTATFAEDGKRKEVVSYFDGSGRSRQQVTINNTEGVAIVGETKYDYVGRPAVNILPAPVANQGIKYYGTSGSPFNGSWDRDNFGTDNHLNENNDTLPEALPSASGAREYYSSSNSLDFINKDALPDAQGYPYTMTHFLNDGTDRPHIQTAPGYDLRYKAQGSHNTKIYYGGSTQSDVDRLFGNEAGYAQFYKKNITIDPNGQQSVQYLDAKDRVVATALSGQNPSSLDTIGDKNVEVITSPIFNKPRNAAIDTALVESFVYMATSFDRVYINYGFDEYFFTPCTQGTPTTSTNAYNVDIKVENDRGKLVVDTSFNMSDWTDASLLYFDPGIGNYTITRRISMDQQVKEAFMQRERDTVEYWKKGPVPNCSPRYVISADTLCPALDCDTACYEAVSYVVDTTRYFIDTAGVEYAQVWNDPYLYYLTPDSTATASIYDIYSPVGIALKECITSCEGFQDTTGGYDMYMFFKEDRCKMKADMLSFDMGEGGQVFTAGCDSMFCYKFKDYTADTLDGTVSEVWIYHSQSEVDTISNFTIEGGEFCTPTDYGDSVLVVSGNYFNILDQQINLDWTAIRTSSYAYQCDSSENTVFTDSNLAEVNGLLGTSFTSWGDLFSNWQPGYASALISTHPEYCAYDYFCNYNESCTSGTLTMDIVNEHGGVMWVPQTYAAAINYYHNFNTYWGTYNFMNPLGFTATSTIGNANQDQHTYMQSGIGRDRDVLVRCNASDTTKLSGYASYKLTEMLQNFIPIVDHQGNAVETSPGVRAYYSLWYFLDDPHGIADVNNNNYYTSLDSSIIQMFNTLHGDGDCINGVITDNDTRLLYFRSIYLFMREKVIYDYFDKQYVCPNTMTPYTFWDADVDFDGTLDDGSGYRLNFPRNPLYEFYGQPNGMDSMMTVAAQQTAGNTQNLAVSRLDTLSCSKFMKYLDDKGYDTTTISVPYANSAAIAAYLKTDFCSGITANEVDSILLCAGGVNYVYTNYLPDTLRVRPADLFLQQAQESCSAEKARLAKEYADAQWLIVKEAYLDSISAYYDKMAYAALDTHERISLSYSLGEYHYTLYYYDQAGNLVRTVPPAGVKTLNGTKVALAGDYRNDSTSGTFQWPDHEYVTNYVYNSQNQVIEQWTPDGGKTYFWYDNAARLVLSQNARQTTDKYSYTIYDGLGRIVESGQITQTNTPTQDTTSSPEDFKKWLLGGDRDQVIFTVYDQALEEIEGTRTDEAEISDAFGVNGQRYLRNRVASTIYIPSITAGDWYIFNNDIFDSLPDDYLDYESATHYSYDPHGNVDVLVQEFNDAALTAAGRRFFKMEYDYDLVSGNVKQVSYQPEEKDEFYHRYQYDADNRITHVTTSRDGVNWEEDARYFYYPHGPLSRAEIGDMNIQGMDYAYTLQGWLKSVNGTSLGEKRPFGTYDLGSDALEDGNANQVYAGDAFGFGLDYFSGDYNAIGADNFLASISGGSNPLHMGVKNLYNGNISRMTTALNDNVQDPMDVMANNYVYDQLNRISSFASYKDTLLNQDNSSSVAGTAGYSGSYFYDPNGNIMDLQRKDKSGTTMDNLTYHYDTAGSYKTNMLTYVDDAAGVVDTVDIGDQSSGNYTYDATGNLTSDASEGINAITWNLQGKVAGITKTGGVSMAFTYDPSGNRIRKAVTESGSTTSTYYVRDASGNVMATYKHKNPTVSLEELNVYGSDRLGVVKHSKTIANDVYVHTSWLEYVPLDLNTRFEFMPSDTTTGISITPSGGDTTIISLTPISDSLVLDLGENVVLGGIYTGSGTITVLPGNTVLIGVLSSWNLSGTGDFHAMLLDGNAVLNWFTGRYKKYQRSETERYIGHKHYEMKNHLGNVLATVSDRKVWKTVDDVVNAVAQQAFIPNNMEESTLLNLEEWMGYGSSSVSANHETVEIASDDPESGGVRTWEAGSNCWAKYCITFDGVGPETYITIYSSSGQYIANHEYIEETEGEVTLCWDISDVGSDNFQVTIVTDPSQPVYIINEELFKVSLPTGWSWLSGSGTNCLSITEGGIEIPYDESGTGIYTTVNVSGGCSHRMCFTVPENDGSGQIEVYEGSIIGDEPYYATTFDSGEICITVSGSSATAFTIVFSVDDGTSFVLSDFKVEDICDIYTQVADVMTAQDYYPGGSVLPGRSFSSNSYRYGYQGSEKDDEITGVTGAHITTHFRELDTRLLRWWSIDPKANSSESPYMSMNGSPIWVNDVRGDTGDVANNAQSRDDIMSLAKSGNQKYVTFEGEGEFQRIGLDFGSMSQTDVDALLKDDEGLNLISDVVNSEQKMLYEASEIALMNDESYNRKAISMYADNNGVVNASNGGVDSRGGHTIRPRVGYDGHLVISADGSWTEYDAGGTVITKSRASMVFHELAETYERTHNCTYYGKGDPNGAHELAKTREGSWHGKSNYPGGIGSYSNPNSSNPSMQQDLGFIGLQYLLGNF